jgi:hypothetical protein
MSETSVDVFAVRHGLPGQDGSFDPGLHPSGFADIDATALAISQELGSTGQIMVFSSPAKRALQTAERLLHHPALQSMSLQDSVEVSSALGEDAFASLSDPDQSLGWVATLHDMADRVISQGLVNSKPALILVTHQPVLLGTLLRGRRLKQDQLSLQHAGSNHFVWQQPSA